MNIALIIAQVLIQYGPEAAQKLAELFHQQDPPTLDQWNALFAIVKPLYEGSKNPPQ